VQRLREFVVDLTESDEARYAKELQSWAAAIPGTVRVAQAPLGTRVRIAGEVRRITIRPRRNEFDQSYEVALYDGTGEIRVIWPRRKRIPGVTLGSRLLVEGAVAEERGVRRMTDPEYEVLPLAAHKGKAVESCGN
jgi:hypothetical protein